MPNMQKRPPGGAKGPQETRVYAPTHRAESSAAGGRSVAGSGASSGYKARPSAANRGNGATQPQRPAAGQAPRRPSRPSVAEELKHGSGISAENRTVSRRQPEQPHGAKQTRLKRDVPSSKERLAAQAKEQLSGKAQSKQDAAIGARRAQGPARSEKQKGFNNIHRLEHVDSGHSAEKEAEKKKKRLKKKREPLDQKRLLIVLITCVAALGLLLLGYFVFLLDTVAVDGNETYSDAGIVELSGFHAGTHLLLCDLNKAKAGIEANPYLKVLSIRRELPRTIRISVEERKEVAALAGQGYDVIIDKEGYVLSIGAGSDLSGLLRVTGMSQLGFHVNQKLGANSDFQTQTLLSMIEQLMTFDLLKDVAELDLSNPLNVCLYTRDGITVTFGQPDDLPGKLAWMRDVLPSLQAGGITGGTLDVSAKGGPIYSPAETGMVSPTSEQENTPVTENPGGEDPEGETTPLPETSPAGQGGA